MFEAWFVSANVLLVGFIDSLVVVVYRCESPLRLASRTAARDKTDTDAGPLNVLRVLSRRSREFLPYSTVAS